MGFVLLTVGMGATGVRIVGTNVAAWTVESTPTTSSNFIVLKNCEAVSNNGHGCAVLDSSDGTNTTNFTLDDCHASANGGHGALLRDTLPQVRGGMYINNGGYGIQLGEAGDVLPTTGANIDHPRLEGNILGTFSEGVGSTSEIKLYDTYFSLGYQVNESASPSNIQVGYRGTDGGYRIVSSNGWQWVMRSTDGSFRMSTDTPIFIGPLSLATGAGTPEGVRTARRGSLYMKRDAGGNALYVKNTGTSGSGTNIGWAPISAVKASVDGGGINYIATANDEFITNYGVTTVTLPAPTDVGVGRVYTVKNMGTGSVTVDVSGGAQIDNTTTLALSVQYQAVTLISASNRWLVTGQYIPS